jgi:hypothetical protein
MLMCCVCIFSFHWESSDMILGNKPLLFQGVPSQCRWWPWQVGNGAGSWILHTGSCSINIDTRSPVLNSVLHVSKISKLLSVHKLFCDNNVFFWHDRTSDWCCSSPVRANTRHDMPSAHPTNSNTTHTALSRSIVANNYSPVGLIKKWTNWS